MGRATTQAFWMGNTTISEVEGLETTRIWSRISIPTKGSTFVKHHHVKDQLKLQGQEAHRGKASHHRVQG
eukprot:667493-Prorocentrum_lima.AAC.1